MLHMASDVDIFLPQNEAAISACFPAFKALRPHLDSRQFSEQVQRQFQQGYRILCLRESGVVQSVAGFRLAEYLAWGRILYIDDLSTLPESRGKGYAHQLLNWLIEHAKENGCQAVHLDSGHQRYAAHRIYLNSGFVITSHHFSLALS